MIKALLWSEWRRQRFSLLRLTGGTLLLWLIVFVGSYSAWWATNGEMLMPGLLTFPPMIYVLLLSSELFFQELSGQTNPYLLGLPISPGRLFGSKFGINLLFVLVLTGINTGLWRMIHGPIQTPPYGQLVILLILLLLIFHATVITVSLTGGRAAGFLLSIAIVIVTLPMAALPLLWMSCDQALDVNLIFWWLFLIGINRYLWAGRISMGKSLVPPLCLAGTMILLLPLSVYGLTWSYAAIRLHQATREFTAAGLRSNQSELAVIRNSPLFQEFYRLFDLANRQNHHVYNFSLASTGRRNSINEPAVSYLKKLKSSATDVITATTSPTVQKLDQVVREIEQRPSLILLVGYHPSWSNGPEPLALVVGYLTVKAEGCALTGDEQGFFRCLTEFRKPAEGYLSWSDWRNKEKFAQTMSNLYYLAAMLGPETPSAAIQYRQLLRTIRTTIAIPHNPEPYRQWMEWAFKNSLFDATLGRPDRMLNTAASLRQAIREENILRNIGHWHSWPELAEDQAIPQRSRWQNRVYQFLADQTNADAISLALALRIYHIEHRHFPETLAALAPAILPQIPLDAITGKPFIYERGHDRFRITSSLDGSTVTDIDYYPLREYHTGETAK